MPFVKRTVSGEILETKLMYKGKSTLLKERFFEKILNFFKISILKKEVNKF